MIELKHISKTFPTADGVFQALDDINLTIRDGDIFGIVGMSGAGKSTLLKIIIGAQPQTSGTMSFHGAPMNPGPPWTPTRRAWAWSFRSSP